MTLTIAQMAANARQAKNAALPTPSTYCTASDITFGSHCLNCGGVDGHAPQRVPKS